MSAAENVYFFRHGDTRQGPATLRQMRKLVAAGTITKETLISAPGTGLFPARQLAELWQSMPTLDSVASGKPIPTPPAAVKAPQQSSEAAHWNNVYGKPPNGNVQRSADYPTLANLAGFLKVAGFACIGIAVFALFAGILVGAEKPNQSVAWMYYTALAALLSSAPLMAFGETINLLIDCAAHLRSLNERAPEPGAPPTVAVAPKP